MCFLEPGARQRWLRKVETQVSEGIPGEKSGRGTALKSRAPWIQNGGKKCVCVGGGGVAIAQKPSVRR